MPRRRSRGRRTLKSGSTLWTGFNAIDAQISTAIVVFNLWDPALYTQLAVGNVTMNRIVGNLRWTSLNTATPSVVAWYFGVFDTDATDTVPAAIIPNPSTSDVDTLEKKDLFWFGSTRIAGDELESGSIFDLTIDMKNDRKLGGNKALLLVMRGTVAAGVQLAGTVRLLANIH